MPCGSSIFPEKESNHRNLIQLKMGHFRPFLPIFDDKHVFPQDEVCLRLLFITPDTLTKKQKRSVEQIP